MSDESQRRAPPPPRKAQDPAPERASRPEDVRKESVDAKPVKSRQGAVAEPKVQIAERARTDRRAATMRIERDAAGNPIVPSGVSGPEVGMPATRLEADPGAASGPVASQPDITPAAPSSRASVPDIAPAGVSGPFPATQ